MIRIFYAFLLTLTLAGLAACQSVGSIGRGIIGSDETVERAAMPSDTHDNCTARVVEGVNFLSSGTSSGGVRLGMSECELIGVLGTPSSIVPGSRPGARRFVTMTYANDDGTGTSYAFVDNSLKEMHRLGSAPPALAPQGADPTALPGSVPPG